ncbi:MAG: translocation/assembly module TamB domain-containing protein [Fidelibacterota bacterium]
MKHVKTILIGLTFILIVALNIFLQSSLWRSPIQTYINNKLKEHSKWQIVIPELSGNLGSTINGLDIRLTNQNGTEVIIGEFHARMNIFKTIIGKPTLSFFQINNIEIHPVFQSDNMIMDENIDTTSLDISTDFNFVIEDISLDGFIEIPLKNDTSIININLKSYLKINPTKKEFHIDEFSASLNDTLGYVLLRNTSLIVFETRAEIGHANGVMNGLPFGGDFYYDWTVVPDFSGDIHIDRYEIPDKIFKHRLLKSKFSSIETFLHFESDLTNFQGDLTVRNPLGLFMKGDLSLTRHDEYISLNRLGLESEESNLTITGIYEDNGRISGNALLSQFDLSKWITDQKPTNVNGTIILDGTIKKGSMSDISMTMEINESELYKANEISISGSLFYNDNIISFDNPLSMSVGPSFIDVKGFADLGEEKLDLELKLNEASVFLINNFWSDSLTSGIATGDLLIKGLFNNPMIKAELDCRNLGYKEMVLEDITLNAHWIPADEGGDGFFRGKIGKGSWRKYGFDYGIVDIAFSSNGIEFQSAEFKQNENYLQTSGIISPDSILSIDRLQLAYENHYFINAKPFRVKYQPNRIEFYPFEFHVDDGIATGQMVIGDAIRGQFQLSNINADIMKLFTDDERFHISGNSFGDISVMDIDNQPEVKMDITLKNGIIARQQFSEMVIAGSIYQSTLTVDEITLVSDGKQFATLSGFIPIGKTENGEREFDFYTIFNDLDISILTQFIKPKFFMDGKITGGFHLGGSPKNTLFDYDLIIEDAIWDRLALGKVASEGLFDGHRLYLNKFSSEYPGSMIAGSAYLPIDYNLSSEKFGRYFESDSLWLLVNGKTKDLEFLSAYISTIDSITGDFDIELELNGPIDSLVRDGHITSQNGTIYSTQLDDPIQNVDGNGALVNNQLLWRNLSGAMVDGSSRKNKSNIFVTGSMDMTSFFRPSYQLGIKGNELHFRTLLGDMEGICNLDLSLTGKEVIEISGKIEPVDAVMYQEFAQSSEAIAAEDEGSVQINYLLNFPITGEFALRNSQIDAHLSGELSMTKLGNYDTDYGGELFVRGGKFYLNQNVFTISEGYFAFNKQGFNPYVEIEAFTKIKDEHIIIKLNGNWDNPQIILESSSGFSESDIIGLLTIGSRFDPDEISAKGLGNQAQNILGAYLERQLERNFLQSTGLDNTGIVDNVSISGTAGLIDPTNSQEFEISAETQISNNLSLNYSYKRSFSLSNPNTNKVGVELRLNRYVSLVGNVDETGNMHVKYRLRYSY